MTDLAQNFPAEIQSFVEEIARLKDKGECLRNVYEFISVRYHGERLKTYTHISDLFKNKNAFWNKRGFLHCTNLNYLLKTLLRKSGLFREDDIKEKWTLVWYISPHQYLRVRISESDWINVDVWSKTYGIPFGDYAHGFHSGSVTSKK